MWLWIMEAPASRHASASAAISDGSMGTEGLVAFEVVPFMAHSMMTGWSCSAGSCGVTQLHDIRERPRCTGPGLEFRSPECDHGSDVCRIGHQRPFGGVRAGCAP